MADAALRAGRGAGAGPRARRSARGGPRCGGQPFVGLGVDASTYNVAMTDQAAVPFWLQVAAVALAPALGFFGVAIGSISQARNSRKLALRSHRQDVYMSFLEAAERYHSLFSIKLFSVFKVDHKVQREENFAQVIPHRDALSKAYLQVTLVASKRTIVAAKRVSLYSAFYATAILDALSGNYSSEEWQDLSKRSIEAIKKFQFEASRDLGVSSRRFKSMDPELEFDEFEIEWSDKKSSPVVDELKDRLRQPRRDAGPTEEEESST